MNSYTLLKRVYLASYTWPSIFWPGPVGELATRDRITCPHHPGGVSTLM